MASNSRVTSVSAFTSSAARSVPLRTLTKGITSIMYGAFFRLVRFSMLEMISTSPKMGLGVSRMTAAMVDSPSMTRPMACSTPPRRFAKARLTMTLETSERTSGPPQSNSAGKISKKSPPTMKLPTWYFSPPTSTVDSALIGRQNMAAFSTSGMLSRA